MRRGFAVAALVLLAARPAGAVPALSSAAVLDQLESALNAGNVDAFVAWFTPDGVIQDAPGSTVAGGAKIRAYAQALAARNYRSERGPTTVEGTRLRWTSKVTFDGMRALGVEHVDGAGEAVIERGKVKSYRPAFTPGAQAMAATAAALETEQFARSYVAEVFNAGTLDRADDYLAAEFVDHAPFPGRAPTLQGFKDGLAELRTAIPDLRVEVEDVVAAGDRAVIRSVWNGVHQGTYQGALATQRQVRVGSIEVLRLKDGKIVESWRQLDSGELAKQLGLFESAAAAKPSEGKGRGARKKKGATGGILGWLNDL